MPTIKKDSELKMNIDDWVLQNDNYDFLSVLWAK